MPKGIKGFQKGHKKFSTKGDFKRGPRISLFCKVCNKEFFVTPYGVTKRKHCSQQCHNIANKNRQYNSKWRRKIGKANLKRIWTLKSREKAALTRSRINPKGKDSHFWQGGITQKKYPKLWTRQLKERIRVRDNFICQICKIPELELNRRLSIHHIDYDKKNCQKDNLICLCNTCHQKTNLNHKYWQDYLSKEMKVYR